MAEQRKSCELHYGWYADGNWKPAHEHGPNMTVAAHMHFDHVHFDPSCDHQYITD